MTEKLKTTQVLRKLVAMQLRDVFDLSYLKSTRKIIFKVSFFVIAMGLYTLAAWFILNQSVRLFIVSLNGLVPDSVMVLLFTIMMTLSILNCTIGLTRSLYFSKDNQILITKPAKPNVIFLSKLIVFYIRELVRNFTFIIPLFVAFGIVNGLSFWFYPLLIFFYFFISAIPVLIGALLSIPALFITMFIRNKLYLVFAIYASIAIGLTVIVFFLVSAIPENFNIIQQFSQYYWALQSFLNNFMNNAVPFAWLTQMIIGRVDVFGHDAFVLRSLFVLLGLICTLIVLFLVVFIVSKPIYLRMASKPFEYNKSTPRPKKNTNNGQYITALKKELRTSIRTPDMFLRKFALMFVMPMALFLLNASFSAMDTRLEGNIMALAFNILMMMLLVLTFNAQTAEIFSSEGKSFYQLKTAPIKLHSKLAAKLTISLVVTGISILATSIIYLNVSGTGFFNAIGMFFTMIFFALGYMLWCAQLDLANPQWQHYNDEKTHQINPNMTRGLAIAFIISFIIFGVSWFFFTESIVWTWVRLVTIAVIFAVVRAYLFWVAARVHFRDF